MWKHSESLTEGGGVAAEVTEVRGGEEGDERR